MIIEHIKKSAISFKSGGIMKVYDLTCNHRKELLGTDQLPYFSWKIESEEENTLQKSYRIIVKDKDDTVYDSGITESQDLAFIPYQGEKLKSCTRYTWSVEVEDSHGNKASAQSFFETAFMNVTDWKAVFVQAPFKLKKRGKGFGNQPPATMFRRSFDVDGSIKKARLYMTSHGIYEAYVNGRRVDDRSFAPEYTSYDRYLCYQTYDVSELLKKGKNVLGVYTGDGWYFCPSTTMNKKTADQDHAILYQLEITMEDGKKITVCSDGSEKATTGPVCFSDLFAGEKYDANLECPGWNDVDFDDGAWSTVLKKEVSLDNLHAQIDAPVRAVREVEAKRAYVSPKGENIIDFGQNLAGHVRFRVDLPKGQSIILEHFETPDQEGNYFNNILGTQGIGDGCDQKVEYVSDGKEAVYEAKFSFHGFRYVRVSGLKEINKEDFKAIAMSSDKKEIGTFSCSDERINRLYENTRWSQRSNMLSIPTDCPQREKAGWTGDIGIYAPTALQNEDVTPFLTRWLQSVSADQRSDGSVPMVVPENQTYQSMNLLLKFAGGLFKGSVGVAGWGDACVLVPKAMYEQTGNIEILKKQYPTMKKWADFIIMTAKKYRGNKKLPKEVDQLLWNTGFHYGEWLIPSKTKNGLSDARSMQESMKDGKKYVPETYAYLTMSNLSKIASLLGKKEDGSYYGDMAEKMKDAFAKGVIQSDGKMPVEVMGSYVLPLHYGLVPEDLRKSFIETIIRKIDENGGCLDTGFLATPILLDTLCENGHTKKAYDLLFQDKCPSWLYEVDHGATTIWESWITANPDGSPMSVSLNHYAFGCVDDWMFRNICGLSPMLPGYRKFKVQPVLDDRISSAKRTFESTYGKITVDWTKKDGRFDMKVDVPSGSEALIVLPDGQTFEKGSGSYSFSCKAA